MDAHALLKELGFGDYEAKAYVGLANAGQCNGYELAKATGMPRANVYAVLERLVERGAAQRFDTAEGVRYAATPPELLLAHLDQQHQRTLAATHEALTALAQPEGPTPAFNLHSQQELLAQAHADIDDATESLLVAIQPAEAAQLAEPLRAAHKRGVSITCLCLQACEHECGGCQGDIHRFQLAPADNVRWLLLVADRQLALLGRFDGANGEGLATAQRLVVELTSAYIRQSLTLAMLARELGERYESLLTSETQQILNRFYPGGDFLAHFKSQSDTELH
ncbi:MAG TPA: helix-turn-helix domain-containing protein [Woeseiaceae bacterium]|nr:helix-turn-helix domain-containing protein [Woeseiaceae bacterium]